MSNSNLMVAHIWANRSKPRARSSNGNSHFEGDTIFSYRTPIAKIYPFCALATSERYSVTTSGKHMPAIRHAVQGQIFYVPSIGADGRVDHKANLKYYQQAFAAAVRSWERARDEFRVRWASKHAAALADTMRDYANAFHLKSGAWVKPYATFHATRADVEAKRALRDTPERIAARAKAQARRDAKRVEQERLAALAEAEKIEAWKRGELEYYRGRYGVPAMLRVKGDVLQTSQGAEVPLPHAILAFKQILKCRNTKTEWHRNGHSIHVGHFTVDSIDADGNMRAGCHRIEWNESERIAKQLGLIP